ncbi:RHS repeat-associated core domain-containing protein [Paenibacillus alvei]|nr:RHS repeat-associated core domain-containing protein [Paenibacillus alvei]MEC0084397.1 RHS repeat-associated core domain-containing protein [Paenibacillus alvei]
MWGNPLVQEEKVPNIFRYSGEYWDAATSLQYLRARWYDPSVGRFINEDTYEGDIGSPLSLNLYTYVKNNTLKYLDPTGHIEFSVGDKEALLRYQSIFSVGQKEKNLLMMQSAHDAANYLRLNYESRVDRTNFFKDGIIYKFLTKDMYNELLFGNDKEVPLLDDPLFYVFDGTFALA